MSIRGDSIENSQSDPFIFGSFCPWKAWLALLHLGSGTAAPTWPPRCCWNSSRLSVPELYLYGINCCRASTFFLRSRRCGILRITVKCPFLLDIATLVSGIQHHVMKASFRSGPMLSYISEAAFSGFFSLDGELFHCSFIYTGSISTVRGFSTVQGQRLHL